MPSKMRDLHHTVQSKAPQMSSAYLFATFADSIVENRSDGATNRNPLLVMGHATLVSTLKLTWKAGYTRLHPRVRDLD